MVGDAVREVRPDVGDAQHVHEKLAELEAAGGDRAGPLGQDLVTGGLGDLGVLVPDRPGAGAGGHDHRLGAVGQRLGEGVHVALHQG